MVVRLLVIIILFFFPAIVDAATAWSPLKVGAGGFIVGMDICADGTTAIIRTDTYGAYVKNLNDNSVWSQLIRSDTMPEAYDPRVRDGASQMGVYAVAVAPSDCNRLYMSFLKKIYKSTDRGVTWTDTAFSYTGTMDPNDSYRTWGGKMAVDPANPDVVYAGTVDNGLFVTLNGGTSWALVAGVPAGGAQGITGIVFDNSSGTTGGKTNTIYATRNGTGVYQTTDAGANWSLLADGPTAVSSAAVTSAGTYFAVTNNTDYVWKYSGASWSNSLLTCSQVGLHSITIDPFNDNNIAISDDAGNIGYSTNGGTNWTHSDSGNKIRAATDIPWLAWTPEAYMSNGSMRFDPVVQNRVWFTEGIGVWYSDNVYKSNNAVTWTSSSSGIEQLVGRDVLIPPGGNVVVAGMDRRTFYLDTANTTYPSTHGTEASPTNAIVHGWSVDYTADNASNLVGLVNYYGPLKKSGYSTDGGQNWTLFDTEPNGASWGPSGCISATSLDNILIVQGHAGASAGWLWRSTDRGGSWSAATLPGATNNATEQGNLH